MSTESVEQRLDQLQKEMAEMKAANAKLQHELERAAATKEILNLVGRLQAYHTACREDLIQSLFSSRDDNRVYFGSIGYWESQDASDRAGTTLLAMSKVGNMPLHLMCNPIIEVAEDGQTAQAYFVAVGIVAQARDGVPTCGYEWTRYGDDFIKENGKWRLWHHHVFDLCRPDWDEKWADQFKPKEMPKGEAGGGKMPAVDGPPTQWDRGYRPDEELPFIPLPKPYQTWDPKQIY